MYMDYIFFFSSRRRHTRFSRDWSSDVCSSDLELEQTGKIPRGWIAGAYNVEEWRVKGGNWVKLRDVSLSYNLGSIKQLKDLTIKIGRASCRERVEISVVAGTLKKKRAKGR